MKVNYSMEERLCFSGTLEMTEEEYNDLKGKGEDELGNIILDMIDRNDPQDWAVESVDDFSKIE